MVLAVCTVDFETRSFLDVRKVGAWRYAEDITTEILFLSYKFGDEKTLLWRPGEMGQWGIDPFPQAIIDHVEAGGVFEAHNVQFERAIWLFILRKQFNIPVPKKWQDTLAVCAYRGIPLALDKAGGALDLPIQKDPRGKYLLQTLSMPKWGTKSEPDRIYREDPDLMEELGEYCISDGDAEHTLSKTLGVLPPSEHRLWVMDQKINQRGIQIDIEAVKSAIHITDAVSETLNGELIEITDGEVTRATQRDRLIKWLQGQDLPSLDNLRKETVEGLLDTKANGAYKLEGKLQPETLRVLEIRRNLAKSSTKKLQKMLDTVSEDGRIRGMLQYHGAGTGRWAGRLVQPHNFPRPTLHKKDDMETLAEMIKLRDPDILYALYGSAMSAVSSFLRGCFVPAPGKVFRVCDFSAIEARVVFWLAHCKTGLDVFHASDRKESEDIYCVTASDLVGFEVLKKKHDHERALGKITVLGCGYQMGWERLQQQAEMDYKVILENHEAQNMVNLYRDKYKEVKYLWYGLNDAAISTVQTGNPHSYNDIVYELIDDDAGRWLACVLPNGRRIWYFEPVIDKVSFQVTDKYTGEHKWITKDSLTYMGRDNKRGGAWGRVRTYGGMLCLAADTKVLTNRGWFDIVNVQSTDLLWDGVEWVNHSGLIYQGEKNTINLDGARMTPDHEVLQHEGWVKAADCSIQETYSVGETLREPEVWEAIGDSVSRTQQKSRVNLGSSLRLWGDENIVTSRFKSWGRNFLWLRSSREEKESRYCLQNTRHVSPSSVSCLAINARPVQITDSPSMEKLRGSWDTCLRSLGDFRKVLGRYGRFIQEGTSTGEKRQQWSLFPRKLLLGYPWRTVQKSTNQRVVRHAEGENDGGRSISNFQYKNHNTSLPIKKRVGCRESVYDLTSAGPRKRFMIKGNNGVMIVHNCENVTQAVARDMMAEAMVRVELKDYPIILTVHDEVISETFEDHGSQEEFEELMAMPPPWALDCPVAVEGATITRYQKV